MPRLGDLMRCGYSRKQKERWKMDFDKMMNEKKERTIPFIILMDKETGLPINHSKIEKHLLQEGEYAGEPYYLVYTDRTMKEIKVNKDA